ncbi:hypothetical protein GCM10010313_20340 [Streptomyces violarus]|uniref:Phage/plasmid-associated DNA primase n=1 Tax=Streptomyces violarus TaxID=67380 RepID=A0A7W5F0S5_9ACTN|nr:MULTISPECIES: hypothetical protein [Streptomyces]MBB3075558.1 phage/plasmid-associated DNA primase [Streptomyces violarus]WRT98154.1 hypothetical protein VJ737_10860 [Streptomyces sp. CGMCC 4.1772]GHD04263.1 hypothetical protein GCM10010313_20340 [Streptomyces violarus]
MAWTVDQLSHSRHWELPALSPHRRCPHRRRHPEFQGLYQNESNWDPECVIWVASNAFPQPRGDDDAIWGRFRPVEFTEVYGPDNPRRNPMLPQELEAELEGMAAWAVEGLRMYLRDGLGDVPHVMQMTATKFMENADQVRRFIFEAEEAGKINLTVDGQCVRTDLYKVYSEWAKVSGVGALGNRRFYERLASVPGVSRTDKMSSGKRYVSGLNLNTTSWNATSDLNGYA